jgi:endonuclease/exonuclease/phosphatase family metal-dependent hydrolase
MHMARSKYPLIVAVAALAAFLFPDQARAQDRATVRILAYNIKHGEGMDQVIDLERAARLIDSLDPDIVTLQEIDSAVDRTSRVDQATRLGELAGMHSAFGGFFDYQGGRYGMALLSKQPFVDVANHRLPDGAEPRTALAGRVRVGEPPVEILVVGIHLYATAEERYVQAERLVEVLADETAPVILAGDFNSRPRSEVMALLARSWQIPDKGADHLTFPSDAPDREIDYIMYRPPELFEVLDLRVIHEPLVSDHRPVLIELRLLNPANRN